MHANKIKINNLEIYHVKCEKFKTIYVGALFLAPVKKEILAENSLLSQLIVKSNQNYPIEEDFSLYLKKLYDLSLSSYVARYGDSSIFNIIVGSVNSKFLEEDINLFNESVKLLEQTIFRPDFTEEKLNKEKSFAIYAKKNIYSNKGQYANQMFVKSMFKDEKLSLSMGGEIETLENVTLDSLTEAYHNLLKQPCVLYVIGDIEENEIANSAQICPPLFDQLSSEGISDLNFLDLETKDITDIQEIIEDQPIKQSILCMGYRSEIRLTDDDYPGMFLLNGMMGQFFHSTLFQEIREKRSLAYYVGSDYNARKGNFACIAKIDKDSYEEVVNVVKEVINDYQNGNFNDDIIQLTKDAFINQIIKEEDSPSSGLYDIISQISRGKEITMDEKINQIKNITKEDIINAAQKMQLDTIYFLRGTL